jgi:hypothetical protein
MNGLAVRYQRPANPKPPSQERIAKMTYHNTTPSNDAKRAIYERPKEADVVDPNLTADELISIRAVVSERISEIGRSVDSIKSQLEAAKIKQAATGSHSEHVWRIRANDALRYQGRSYQDHCRALGNINRRIRQLNGSNGDEKNKSDERTFVRHARAILPEETYMAIWSSVAREQGAFGTKSAAA